MELHLVAAHEIVGPVVDVHTPSRLAAQRLRNTLRLNAALSLVGATLAAVGPGRLDSWLDTGHADWVRVVGVGVVAVVVGVVAIAGATMSRLLRWAPVVIAGDAAWVLASLITIFAGWYGTAGDLVVAAVAVMVGGFAVGQYITWHGTRSLIDDLVEVDEGFQFVLGRILAGWRSTASPGPQ